MSDPAYPPQPNVPPPSYQESVGPTAPPPPTTQSEQLDTKPPLGESDVQWQFDPATGQVHPPQSYQPAAGAPYPPQQYGMQPPPPGLGGPPPPHGAAYPPQPYQPAAGSPYPPQVYGPPTGVQYSQQTTYVGVEPAQQVIILRDGVPLANPPQDCLVGSILACVFCCVLLGVPAIMYSCRSREAARRGEQRIAEDSARTAKQFIIAAVVCGLVIMALNIVLRAVLNVY